jgi:TolA-binding protein
MKCRIFPSLIVIATLSFPLPLPAQMRGGSSGTSRGAGRRDPNLTPDPSRMMNVSGKVVLDNGTPLAEKALIESNCKGTTRTVAYTDAKGRFSIQFGVDSRDQEFSGTGMASDSTRTINLPGTGQQNGSGDWRDCELKAVLGGFLSQVVNLRSHSSAFGHIDIGNIALHRVAAIAGSTLSVKDAGIPDAAKKDFEKGLEEKKNGNLDVAQKQLRKAVEEYPKYAEAWLELGRAQSESKDAIAARQSFHQSIAADPKLLAPYQELTQLAARDQQWQEVADTTDQMLKMNSEKFPEFWFFNCVAKFYLGNLDGAEHSALESIRTDIEHRIPKTEYVLGVILLKKQDYPGATEHLRKYLTLDPKGSDVADAGQKLGQLQQLPGASPGRLK